MTFQHDFFVLGMISFLVTAKSLYLHLATRDIHIAKGSNYIAVQATLINFPNLTSGQP